MKRCKWIFVALALAVALFGSSCTVQNNGSAESGAEDEDAVLFVIEGADKTQLTRGEFNALEQSTFRISRTNSKGETTTGDYTGVRWDVLSQAIGAPDDAKSLTLSASDGFSQAYAMDVFRTGKSIFAIEKDGSPITEEPENGQVWFCADESYTANYWTKFISKIVIQ